MKKENKVLTFLVVLILIILIAIVAKKIENPDKKIINTNAINKDKLTCVIDTSDLFKITYEFIYKKNVVENITITFKTSIDTIDYSNYSESVSKMNYYFKLDGSKYKYENNDLIMTLDKDVLKKNKEDKKLKKLYNKYYDVKEYFEDQGYSCK